MNTYDRYNSCARTGERFMPVDRYRSVYTTHNRFTKSNIIYNIIWFLRLIDPRPSGTPRADPSHHADAADQIVRISRIGRANPITIIYNDMQHVNNVIIVTILQHITNEPRSAEKRVRDDRQ